MAGKELPASSSGDELILKKFLLQAGIPTLKVEIKYLSETTKATSKFLIHSELPLNPF